MEIINQAADAAAATTLAPLCAKFFRKYLLTLPSVNPPACVCAVCVCVCAPWTEQLVLEGGQLLSTGTQTHMFVREKQKMAVLWTPCVSPVHGFTFGCFDIKHSHTAPWTFAPSQKPESLLTSPGCRHDTWCVERAALRKWVFIFTLTVSRPENMAAGGGGRRAEDIGVEPAAPIQVSIYK